MKRAFIIVLALSMAVLLFLPATLAAKAPQATDTPPNIITPEKPGDTPAIGDSDDDGDLDDLVGGKRDWNNDGDLKPSSGGQSHLAVMVWWKYWLLVRLLY